LKSPGDSMGFLGEGEETVPVFSCDLHIHSALSPCASLEMSARGIVTRAREVGLDIIAITDHNMAENGIYAALAEEGSGPAPLILFGMELQTIEELHLLVIFRDYETAMDFQELVYGHLPDVKNDPEYFGDQVVVDEKDHVVRFEERMLLNSSTISIDEAVLWARAHGGLSIPAHIDSPTFSIVSQLGYVPEEVPFDALEIARVERLREITHFILAKNIPLVTFSDAHYLKDIGRRRISLSMEEPSFVGVAEGLKIFGHTARWIEADREELRRCSKS
jgi:PHP family Zn ribbon phosphoesterase